MDEIRPLVSVIIPTYNRADTIERSVRSVLNQTYTNFELIVVDDGSIDNTEAIISAIEDSRLRYLRHELNKGGGAARNTGIKAAKGDYIAFQDSDDEWLPQKLELQIKEFMTSDKSVGVVYSAFTKYKDGQEIYFPYKSIPREKLTGSINSTLLKDNKVTTQAAVVRKECFYQSGLFDESLSRFQDWELWLRISQRFAFRFIDMPLVNVFYSQNCISSSSYAYIKAMTTILKKYGRNFERSRTMNLHIYSLAWQVSEVRKDLIENLIYLSKHLFPYISPRFRNYFFCCLASQSYKYKETLKIQKRYIMYNDILKKWLKNVREGKKISRLLEMEGFFNIAVYGAGELGIQIYEELKESNIKIMYFIDKNGGYADKVLDVPIKSAYDSIECYAVDAIVVTPVYTYESIREQLIESGINIPILSIEELIDKA